MALSLQMPKCLLLSGAIVLLGLAAPLPALAAPLHAQQFHSDNGNGNGDATPFDLDQSPCLQQLGRRHGQSNQVCDDTQTYSQHSGNGQRRPGSNAFGLQFNYDD